MSVLDRIGDYVTCAVAGARYEAYVPKPLPPDPPLDTASLYSLIDQANAAIGRLDGTTRVLPNTSLFLYIYIRKEAVLSSQIEGTQSSLSDLLLFETNEAPGVPLDDVIEVSNYVAAMEHGLQRIEDGFPLSLRLLREIHKILMTRGRGGNKEPGEFRRSQNWIGGTRPGNAKFVPPPPERLMEVLDPFEKFLHDEETKLPLLVKAALLHVQFETIHPFLDGNGRLGRLLITFLLCTEGMLEKPLLYLSLFFKANQNAYYDHLQLVRETGDWEEWIAFFLTGVIKTADQAIETANGIMQLFDADRQKIEQMSKSSSTALRIHYAFQLRPIGTARQIHEEHNISMPAINNALKKLESRGIIKEITGKRRYRIYAYAAYMRLLNQGIEPLSS